MIVYSFNPKGEFIAPITLDGGDINPKRPDEYIIPANCTIVAPPEEKAGFTRVWDGQEWTLIEDHRGETWYDAQGNQIYITDLGEIPAGLSQTKPPPDIEEVKAEAKQAVIAFADNLTSKVTGEIPAAEVASWPSKEREAALVFSGAPEAETPWITTLAIKKSRSRRALAEEIAQRAGAYRTIAITVELLRSQTGAAIDAATTPEAVEKILEQAKGVALQKAAELGLV